ncbi:MAG TPA: FAD-dependent oxidoreductase [Acidobacteriota bacterium]|nr:FAD-dependent oxidoreductase [Acidobacteriota bacterium]
METEFLIIGAGLAGLSAAYHLGDREHIIVESDQRVGGLCKSFQVDGFTFDCTGHLIHFRTQEGREIITKLIGDKLQKHERKAAIFLENRFTDYPFQANTYGLPPEIVKECLLGFVNTLTRKHRNKIGNFYDWIYETFGEGIAKYFMVPYNQKLWQHDLRDISLDWVNWSIPKPNVEDVINGALGIKNKQFGYNPVFFYPKKGGIGIFPEGFPVNGDLRLSSTVQKINIKEKWVTLNNGQKITYKYLLSTMPLHQLLKSLEDAPSLLTSACSKLEYISVLNINLGIDREEVIPYHWVYFPERNKPFYRIGCLSNICPESAPKSTSSLFVEISLRSDEKHDVKKLTKEAIDALKDAKILRRGDKLVVTYPVLLNCAYVIYNKSRSRTVTHVQNYLNMHDVVSFGRYGSWIYSSMEDAVLQGKEVAEKVLALSSEKAR